MRHSAKCHCILCSVRDISHQIERAHGSRRLAQNVYEMERRRLGHAYIVNTVEREFPGSARDVAALSRVLRQMGLEVDDENTNCTHKVRVTGSRDVKVTRGQVRAVSHDMRVKVRVCWVISVVKVRGTRITLHQGQNHVIRGTAHVTFTCTATQGQQGADPGSGPCYTLNLVLLNPCFQTRHVRSILNYAFNNATNPLRWFAPPGSNAESTGAPSPRHVTWSPPPSHSLFPCH